MDKLTSLALRTSPVTVVAPARLHMGFMDLNGGLGHSFGSLGLTLSALATVVEAESAKSLSVEGEDAPRGLKIAQRLVSFHGAPAGARLVIKQAIPAHAGLGSGTQLALAIGAALARVNGWQLPPRTIAGVAERGARSGIGIGAFERGGFLVDGGRGARDTPPQVIARADFPEAWRVLLIFDRRHEGIHGSREVAAFRALPVFPAESAAHLCRVVMMQLLPALAEEDLAGFGAAVSTLQNVVGDHFAPAQGGRFASRSVSEVLAWLADEGVAGVGQSSWGPTGFALVASEQAGQALLQRAQARWPEASGLTFLLCRGRNHGASITSPAMAPQRVAASAH